MTISGLTTTSSRHFADMHYSGNSLAYWCRQSAWLLHEGKSDPGIVNNSFRCFYRTQLHLDDISSKNLDTVKLNELLLLSGILLVFYGKPRLGILCELFGLLSLFG